MNRQTEVHQLLDNLHSYFDKQGLVEHGNISDFSSSALSNLANAQKLIGFSLGKNEDRNDGVENALIQNVLLRLSQMSRKGKFNECERLLISNMPIVSIKRHLILKL